MRETDDRETKWIQMQEMQKEREREVETCLWKCGLGFRRQERDSMREVQRFKMIQVTKDSVSYLSSPCFSTCRGYWGASLLNSWNSWNSSLESIVFILKGPTPLKMDMGSTPASEVYCSKAFCGCPRQTCRYSMEHQQAMDRCTTRHVRIAINNSTWTTNSVSGDVMRY